MKRCSSVVFVALLLLTLPSLDHVVLADPITLSEELGNITAYRTALENSSDPDDIAALQEVLRGPADLAREEDTATKLGILLTPPPPPPADQDAAPIYAKWTGANYQDGPKWLSDIDPMSLKYKYTPEQLAALQKMYADNSANNDILLQAIDKPYLYYPISADHFPPYGHLREAARELVSESVLLAIAGKWDDAEAIQVKGFKIADQIGQNNGLISYLVAVAIDSITLSGLQNILTQSAPSDRLADTITLAVQNSEKDLSLKSALQSDALEDYALFENLAKGETIGRKTDVSNSVYTQDDHDFLIDIIDAVKARRLQPLIDAVSIVNEPWQQVAKHLQQASSAYEHASPINDPLETLDSDWGSLLAGEMRIPVLLAARENVLLAGAAVLSIKAKTGAFPVQLPGNFSDPWSGKQLLYRLSPGGFTIYSVGPTGKFNGIPKPHQNSSGLFFTYPAPPQIPVPQSMLQ